MKEIGIYEAKTHLAELIDDVELGEHVVITRRGRPVARLIPYRNTDEQWGEIEEAFERIRQQTKPGPPSIREMIEEGRRY